MPTKLAAQEFVDKGRSVQLDHSTSQEHFLDLCHLIDHPTPVEADATDESPYKELVGQRDRWLNPDCKTANKRGYLCPG